MKQTCINTSHTWAEIDLAALRHNFNQLRRRLSRQKILAVVKANAYGHGAVKVAQTLERFGADYFGVATIAEAIELRNNGITSPILLLGLVFPDEFWALIRYRLTPTIADYACAHALNAFLAKTKKRIPVHLKIDTGMGRIGVWHQDAMDFVKTIAGFNHLTIEGIYFHFASADDDKRFTDTQLELFRGLIKKLDEEGIVIALPHCANSAAVMRYRRTHLHLVRPGLMLYGLYADVHAKRLFPLKPVLSFKTKITYVKSIPTGRSISYGRTFISKKPMTVATIAVGYADGYNRLLSNRGQVIVRNKRCPIIGRVCMDQTMIDVTGINSARVGDEAVLIGKQGKESISAEEIAYLCNTISYEVVCWISRRVQRVYTT